MAVIHDNAGNAFDKNNPLPVSTNGDTISVNKGIVNMGKSVPVYYSWSPSVPANTTVDTQFAVASPPVGKIWLIASMIVSTPAGVIVSAPKVDGANTSRYIAASGFDDFNLKTNFGDYFFCQTGVTINATNSTAGAASVTVAIRGWEVTL